LEKLVLKEATEEIGKPRAPETVIPESPDQVFPRIESNLKSGIVREGRSPPKADILGRHEKFLLLTLRGNFE
jgi:hypothetical protein